MHTRTNSLLKTTIRGALVFACLTCSSAYAAKFKVTVTNLAQDDGLWFTPVFFGFHDGNFNLFDAGSNASAFPGIEEIAEMGQPPVLAGRFASDANAGAKSHVLLGQDGAGGPPAALFAPSNFNPIFSTTNSFITSLNPLTNGFLSFASMIVPSNDAFIGNDDSMAHSLFNMDGSFKHGFQIDILGSDIWDSGTELNDGLGAAFSSLGGMSTDTMNPIAPHTGLDTFLNTALPVGPDLVHAFGSDTPIARITVEQVPDSNPYIGLLSAAALIGFRVVSKRRFKKAHA